MGLTERQRKAKLAREGIQNLLRKHGLENVLVFDYNGFGKPYVLFSTDHSKKISSRKLFRFPDLILSAIDNEIVIIHDVYDNMKFEGFEEYRKHILIKKLSGV